MLPLLALFTLPSLTSAALKTSYAYPNGLGDVFQYLDALPLIDYTVQDLTSEGVPSVCQLYADNDGDPLCSTTMTITNVTFSDCSRPWTVCRCDDAQMSTTQLIEKFGRLPVDLRDYVRYLLGFNGSRSAFSNANDMAIFGDCSDEAGLSVFVHESGHDVDQGTSVSDLWAAALANDTCVPDPYGGVSVQEDFAQVGVIQLYIYLYGGVPSGSVDCMASQLATYSSNSRLAKDVMIGTKTCDLDLRSQWDSRGIERVSATKFERPVETQLYATGVQGRK